MQPAKLLTAAGEPACSSKDQINENFSIKKIKIEGEIKQKNKSSFDQHADSRGWGGHAGRDAGDRPHGDGAPGREVTHLCSSHNLNKRKPTETERDKAPCRPACHNQRVLQK